MRLPQWAQWRCPLSCHVLSPAFGCGRFSAMAERAAATTPAGMPAWGTGMAMCSSGGFAISADVRAVRPSAAEASGLRVPQVRDGFHHRHAAGLALLRLPSLRLRAA